MDPARHPGDPAAMTAGLTRRELRELVTDRPRTGTWDDRQPPHLWPVFDSARDDSARVAPQIGASYRVSYELLASILENDLGTHPAGPLPGVLERITRLTEQGKDSSECEILAVCCRDAVTASGEPVRVCLGSGDTVTVRCPELFDERPVPLNGWEIVGMRWVRELDGLRYDPHPITL